jgi:hypothetical protein
MSLKRRMQQLVVSQPQIGGKPNQRSSFSHRELNSGMGLNVREGIVEVKDCRGAKLGLGE